MSSQPNTPTKKRETIEFPADTPVTVALKYGEPRLCSTKRGERYMYSTIDGRVMFLDPEQAAAIADLGINVRENLTITRRVEAGQDRWEIARKAGERPNGTFPVPACEMRTKPTPDSAISDRTSPALAIPAGKSPSRATTLIDEANALVDCYAQVMERALTTYKGRVKPEEARALLISAYIQRQKSAA